MKLLTTGFCLLFAATAFAFPKTAKIEGVLKLNGRTDSAAQMDLVLNKMTEDKAKYKGFMTFNLDGKTLSKKINLEIDMNDQETTGRTDIAGDVTRIQGPVISFVSGVTAVLQIASWKYGQTTCIPTSDYQDYCFTEPDQLVESGTFEATFQ
jgi:hypothetical protein